MKRLGLLALGLILAARRGADPIGAARRLARLPDELPGDLAEARAAGERARDHATARFDEELSAAQNRARPPT